MFLDPIFIARPGSCRPIASIRTGPAVHFYLATSFIFPRSLRLRLLLLCFVATHLPLLAYIGWSAATGRIAWGESVALTLATLIGMIVALVGIGALLSPIQTLAERLQSDDAPPRPGDLIGQLYAGFEKSATMTQARLAQLESAAHEDLLTGVPNRRGFLAQVDRLPPDRRKGCIALVDIDYFKRANDRLGHGEGDRILGSFAGRLSAQLRRIDIVGRWGGEEFVILFQDCIEDEASWSLARVASRLRADPIARVDGRAISFSAGIAHWAGDDLESALRRADEALYRAKEAGRDRICRAHQELHPA